MRFLAWRRPSRCRFDLLARPLPQPLREMLKKSGAPLIARHAGAAATAVGTAEGAAPITPNGHMVDVMVNIPKAEQQVGQIEAGVEAAIRAAENAAIVVIAVVEAAVAAIGGTDRAATAASGAIESTTGIESTAAGATSTTGMESTTGGRDRAGTAIDPRVHPPAPSRTTQAARPTPTRSWWTRRPSGAVEF